MFQSKKKAKTEVQEGPNEIDQNQIYCIIITYLDQGLSKHQEMGFTPMTKVLQSNEGT